MADNLPFNKATTNAAGHNNSDKHNFVKRRRQLMQRYGPATCFTQGHKIENQQKTKFTNQVEIILRNRNQRPFTARFKRDKIKLLTNKPTAIATTSLTNTHGKPPNT